MLNNSTHSRDTFKVQRTRRTRLANIWTINLPNSTKESIAKTGIKGNVMSHMSTKGNQNEGELTPIQQAEKSWSAIAHEEIHWIMAKLPLDETDSNITTILELITVALRLHSLKGVILFLNDARSDKMHPIKNICHFSDLLEWYRGSALIENTTHAGGGIEKTTRIVVIHEEMDPIRAMTTTLEVRPLPANMNEAIDSRPDIIDNYNWPNPTEMHQDTKEPYRAQMAATTTVLEEGQTTH
jgi:hypothetical protein